MTERDFVEKLDEALKLAPYEDEAKQAMLEMLTGNELSGLRRGLSIAEQVLNQVTTLVEARKKELNDEPVGEIQAGK